MKLRTLLPTLLLTFAVTMTANAQPLKQREVAKKKAPGIASVVPKKIQAKAPSLENATVTLNVPNDIWDDGSGYIMLIDADQNLENFSDCEYLIPSDAATGKYIYKDSYTIEVEPGIYEIRIRNMETDGDIYIPGNAGNIESSIKAFKFEAGITYEFVAVYSDEIEEDGINLYVDGILSETETPTNIAASDITDNTAQINWEGDADSWNIRYRPFVEEREPFAFYDFNGEITDWSTIDADEDGFDWMVGTAANKWYTIDNEGACLISMSYDDDTYKALTPDNWLISPEVELGGCVRFYAYPQDAEYPDEVFAVYVNTSGDIDDLEAYEKISEDITVTADYTEYTFDLSAYAGKTGFVAIRHYNCTDQYALSIDNVAFYDVYLPGWSYINDVTVNPFTLAELLSGTEYEVQIQANKFTVLSDWSESKKFTTTDEASGINNLTTNKADKGQWYTINGLKLTEKPTQKGIYIHNGRKAVVK